MRVHQKRQSTESTESTATVVEIFEVQPTAVTVYLEVEEKKPSCCFFNKNKQPPMPPKTDKRPIIKMPCPSKEQLQMCLFVSGIMVLGMALNGGTLSLGAVNALKNENAGKEKSIPTEEIDATAGAAALGGAITFLPLLSVAWCSLGEFYKPCASEICNILAIFACSAIAGAVGGAIYNELPNPDATLSVGQVASQTAGGGGGLESFLYVLGSAIIYCCFGRPGNTGSPEPMKLKR